MMQARLKEEPVIWESEKWHEKLNLPVEEEGAHTSQHIGEISYLRGMQRGMDK